MKTIKDIMYNLTGHGVVEALSQVLREYDTEFNDAEKRYIVAVETLRNNLSCDTTPSVDEYLNACEADIVSLTISAGYLGFRVNIENFHHPIGIDFVRLDTIDYLKDHIIGHFKENYEAERIRDAFYKGLPEELKPMYSAISEYYIFMECAGPKLAHYAGYIIGNHLLPWVEPGYRADRSQTDAFEREMMNMFGYLPI